VTPPAAATAAGRRVAQPQRPRPPRRVSGPARGRAAAPQRAPRPQAPTRRRPVAVPRPARRRDLTRGARLLAWLRALPDHRLVDRLLGGRVWIVLIGTLLVGIVTMQLSLLKLNAGIGRSVARGAALEQRNATLRAEISRLSDSHRIVDAATQMGFVVPPQGTPRFVTASAGDAGRALRVMRVPQEAPVAPVSAPPPVTTTTVAADPAATADPTAADGTMTPVSGTTGDQAAPTTPATTAPVATAPVATAPVATAPVAAGTGAAVTAGATAAGGAAAPQG